MSGSGSGAQFSQLPMFLAPHELPSMHSYDTGGPLRDWRRDTVDNLDPRHDEDTGDPSQYMHHMRKAVHDQGGIEKPIHAVRTSDGDTLLDGNHRAVTAMETHRLVPVLWHQQGGGVLQSALWGKYSDDHSHGV